MKMADAKQKRNEQLKRWIGSETDLEPHVIKRKKTKVKFDDGAVFLAACSSGDTEEVLKLLDRGADINYANVDGLTALHQACIDDNIDMVKFLVEHGASINQPDNEGWIPLHAASSCGYLDIAEYLISKGASVGVVNSEGDTPLDIAEEEAMEELLQNEVNRQGIDVEAARKEEERIMLRDARQWLNSGQINDVRHSKSGGTALHVAAAKGYAEVLKLLIQVGYDINVKDFDGWTPLHAAAHWGKEEACKILVENFCNIEAVNKVGQTALDVADEDILSYLEELQKKQNLLLSEKQEKKSPLIESSTTENNQSLKTLKNKETLIIEQEKTVSTIDSIEQEKVDEEDESKKDESSCSSEEEEEEDSESEAETDKTKSLPPVNNMNSNSIQQASVTSLSSTSGQVTPTSPVKKCEFITPFMPVVETMQPTSWRQGLRKTGIVLVPSKGDKSLFPTPPSKTSPKEEERKDESPASWRLGLRKTGSYGALSEITASKEAQKERDFTGVMRSASSPRLSSTLDNKEKEKDGRGARLAYVAPTIPRRLASTSDIEEKENRESSLGFLRGSSSYTRRKWDEEFKKNTSVNELLNTSYQRSSSFGRRQDDLISSIPPGSTATVTSSGLARSYSSTINSGRSTVGSSSGLPSSFSTSNRFWADDSSEKDKDAVSTAITVPVAPTIVNTTSTSTTMTTTSTGTVPSSSEGRERRRSYLTPVRDEESESQRKARSRQARQSRRSTQGVTLTDLQEAEKTIGRTRPTQTREQENEEREKQDKEKQEDKREFETRTDDFRQRYQRSSEERYRPSLAASTTPSAISLSSSGSSIYTSSQLNRPNSLTGISSSYSNLSRISSKDPLKDELDGENKEEDKESQPKSIRERRRPREKRRSTGVSYWTQDSDENEQDHQSDTDEGTNKKENQTDTFSRYTTGPTSAISTDRYDSIIGQSGTSSYWESRRLHSRLDREDLTDYKKIIAENEKLKTQLHDTNLELTELKLQLEKATQRQERFADRSLLEIEKRERRALERRISEMEEELKMLPDLKADNQRLKDENGALIRVISKLSK
ncbi:protein phosphatase 1 regulatory subunit 12A isoform X2 [Xenopus laevis]|uniref:Protein phosphatase 1 regulatory subunit n=1 Tax=Xenopus laevis TaxID=8355 RepID=A0A8J1MU21_XENLA|nr:protein phosphatase 1 regulatory subunit 12A isoform X2 [Xenopus laevis]